MKSKRLYNREILFISILMLLILTPLIVVGGKRFINRDFEYYLIHKDVNKLYSYIRYPSFSKKIFEKYMDYNFEGRVEILEKKEMNNYIFLTVKTDKFEKIIILRRDNKNIYWDFNDYSKAYTITAPLNTKIFIEDMVYINTNGEVKIENMPFGLYNIEAILENCKPFRAKILTGQNFKINLELNNDAVERCKNIIKSYQKFYQDCINNNKIQSTELVDKNSGLFNEIIDEANWYKESEIKIKKYLQKSEFKNAYLDDNNQINILSREEWIIELKDGNKINKKTEVYNRKYVLSNQNNRLIQIITN